MADKTGISWTDATWNPTVGCTLVSPGCTNCYAMQVANRLLDKPGSHYEGTTKMVNGKAVWTGKLAMAPEHILTQPFRWKRPRKIFVNSMSDLFHEDVPFYWIDTVFKAMQLSPEHTFQILTKRADRMREYMLANYPPDLGFPTPENVWLGVSVEDQRRADERIPILLDTPAQVRFLSCEPLLGPVDFIQHWRKAGCLNWVIVGGESGKGARPFNISWAGELKVQCRAYGVAFFMKQMGSNCVEKIKDTSWDVSPAYAGKGDDIIQWPLDLQVQEFPK